MYLSKNNFLMYTAIGEQADDSQDRSINTVNNKLLYGIMRLELEVDIHESRLCTNSSY